MWGKSFSKLYNEMASAANRILENLVLQGFGAKELLAETVASLLSRLTIHLTGLRIHGECCKSKLQVI